MHQEPCSVLHLKLLAVWVSLDIGVRGEMTWAKRDWDVGHGRGANEKKNHIHLLCFPLLHTSLCLPPTFCINYRCEMLMAIQRPLKSILQMQNLREKQRMWKSNFSTLINDSLVYFRSTFRSSSISNFFWKPWSLIGRVPHVRGPTFGFLAEHFRPVKVLLGTEFTLSDPAKKNIE